MAPAGKLRALLFLPNPQHDVDNDLDVGSVASAVAIDVAVILPRKTGAALTTS